jgi:hypothetical protein
MADLVITKIFETVTGNNRLICGSFANAGTGGEIRTGLNQVYDFMIQPNAAAVVADGSTVNETFPLPGGVVTIVTTAATAGYFLAIGV